MYFISHRTLSLFSVKWEGGTEVCHFSPAPTHAQPPCYQHHNVHLLPRINLHWDIILTQSLWFTLGFTLGILHSCGLDKCIMACIHHYNNIHIFFAALKIIYVPSIHPSLYPQLLSVSMHLSLLGISYKWNHTVCGPLWLAFFT